MRFFTLVVLLSGGTSFGRQIGPVLVAQLHRRTPAALLSVSNHLGRHGPDRVLHSRALHSQYSTSNPQRSGALSIYDSAMNGNTVRRCRCRLLSKRASIPVMAVASVHVGHFVTPLRDRQSTSGAHAVPLRVEFVMSSAKRKKSSGAGAGAGAGEDEEERDRKQKRPRKESKKGAERKQKKEEKKRRRASSSSEEEEEDEQEGVVVFTLKILQKGSKPPCWRLVEVPGHYTLHDLHRVIHTVIGWNRSKRHTFRFSPAAFPAVAPPVRAPRPDDHPFAVMMRQQMAKEQVVFTDRVYDAAEREETEVTLSELGLEEKKKFEYEYDSMFVVVSVEKVEEGRAIPCARVLKGKMDNPPNSDDDESDYDEDPGPSRALAKSAIDKMNKKLEKM